MRAPAEESEDWPKVEVEGPEEGMFAPEWEYKPARWKPTDNVYLCVHNAQGDGPRPYDRIG